MFESAKTKRIQKLPEEDRGWAQGVTKKNAAVEFIEAVTQDNVLRMSFIEDTYPATRETREEALRAAVQHLSVNALKKMLSKWGYNSISAIGEDKSLVRQLFMLAAAKKNEALWKALCDFNDDSGSSCKAVAENLMRAVVCAEWVPAIETQMNRTPAGKDDIFAIALCEAQKKSAETLAFVLSFSGKFSETRGALNNALAQSARDNASDKVELLVNKSAEPNHAGGIVLFSAAENDNREMVDFLLARGCDLTCVGEDVLTQLKQKSGETPMYLYLRGLTDKAVAEKIEAVPERYTLAGPDTLCEQLKLPGGLLLTTLFNFQARQQIVIAERPHGGMTMAIKTFDELDDKRLIENVRRKLAEIGGNVHEPQTLRRNTGTSRGLNREQL